MSEAPRRPYVALNRHGQKGVAGIFPAPILGNVGLNQRIDVCLKMS
jgi:hypothetical protein